MEPFHLLDVRSSGEFDSGAAPGAVCVPILANEERALVGTLYKRSGQSAAINLGHQLVCGEVKDQRVRAWQEQFKPGANGGLYCARGGLRSEIAQEWLAEAGCSVPRVQGGYKALRNYFLNLNEVLPEAAPFVVVSGKTGCGKTELLQKLASVQRVIDLEALANHRGSAFGDVADSQPSQASFENTLAVQLLRGADPRNRPIFVEAESRRIGRLFIPETFWRSMSRGAIVVLDAPFEVRVQRILDDYISSVFERFARGNESDAHEQFSAYLLDALRRIGRHLGGERATRLQSAMTSALEEQRKAGSIEAHRSWIEPLLLEYYDPHYEKSPGLNSVRTLHRGSFEALLQYCINYRS